MKFCHMKQLILFSNSLHFQCLKLILSGQVFHDAHSLIYNQIDCFAFFFETINKGCYPCVAFLKSVGIYDILVYYIQSDEIQEKMY